jgi:class 3 adenylate cyclase
MIDTIQEFKEQMQKELGQYLDIKVGIHTGRVVAGIIGSRVVRYDIFGEGVVIGNKILQEANSGAVLVSDETMKKILDQNEVAREYNFEYFKKIECKMIGKSITTYSIKKNEEVSIKDVDSLNS